MAVLPFTGTLPPGSTLRILHRLSIRFLLYKTYRLLAVSLALGPDMEGVTFTGNSFYAFLPSHFRLPMVTVLLPV